MFKIKFQGDACGVWQVVPTHEFPVKVLKQLVIYPHRTNVPETIIEQTDLLRLVRFGDGIVDVGYRLNDQEFWLYSLERSSGVR